MATKPLSSRPLDMVYFIFFAFHIPATLLIDCQAIYPQNLLPEAITQLPKLYIDLSNDPLMGPAMGYPRPVPGWIWFKSFLWIEIFFQLPVFILGARGLWKGSKSIYVLLLIYAASTSTTLFPCLAIILTTPLKSAETIAANTLTITPFQLVLLLSSYVPFLLIPLLMTVDMAFRITGLVKSGLAAQKKVKRH